MMRWGPLLGGGVLIIIGTIWLLQGLNVLPGSFMTGQTLWAWAGLLALLVGLGLLLVGLRRGGVGR
jgi:hypothetical protein